MAQHKERTIPEKFDAIRPYEDSEVAQALESLFDDREFRLTIQSVTGKFIYKILKRYARGINSIWKFQKKIVRHVVRFIVFRYSDGLSSNLSAAFASGGDNNLYISNHRDIIVDSGILAYLLFKQGHKTEEIGIGDNLLIRPWIEKVVKANRCFVVKRSLHASQLMDASELLSEYMRFTITQKEGSIWLAQREGRAKDSNDRTQPSVLKMISLSKKEGQDMRESLAEMHIVPLAISYEYDPCDYLKAQEFQQKRDNPAHKKSKADDMMNMKTGLLGYKGRIHYQATERIDSEILGIDASLPDKQVLEQVAQILDNHIFESYRIYPCNYVALDMLQNSTKHSAHYTKKDYKKFVRYLDGQIAKVQIENPDTEFLKSKILEMYANPLKNHLEATSL